MSIEAWATTPAGVYIAHLDRSEASPFRGFAVSRTRGADPGTGSLEHHLDNALLLEFPELLADGNLVWMKYRDRTMAWVIEERRAVLDEQEHQTDWVQISGRGAKQLLADRTVWPTAFSETALDPALWGASDWKTTLDGSAASGQRIVPVASTTGAIVNDPVQLTGGADSQLGIIESIVDGVSVTLVDDLAFTFPIGSRIVSAARQWRRFVNRPAGEMLWDLIAESNARPGFAMITRGTIETTGDDGWTQDLRFDNLLDVAAAVVASFGDIDMAGLTFSYLSDPGVDRSATVIFEESADLLRVERTTSDRDTVTWVVAEGVGEGITAKLAVAADQTATRRREGYLDAKDAGNLPLVQLRADAAIEELKHEDSIAFEVTEDRYRAFDDYDVHDTVRVIAPSRGIDEAAVIVALYLAEDDTRGVRVLVDVNSPREEALLRLDERQRSTRRSLGVRNRQPQGTLVPFAISDTTYFDTATASITGFYIPDRMQLLIECRVALDFDEYPMPVSASASSGSLTSDSGGGATSGASSASSSSGNGFAWQNVSTTSHSHGGGASASLPETPVGNIDSSHTHPIPHTHSTPSHQHTVPGHTHSLTAASTKEAYPASHSVEIKVYELVGSTWTLRGTVSGLVGDVEDLDLTAYVTGPGRWRITLQSAGGQPQGGRLGAHLSGYVLGAIQSA